MYKMLRIVDFAQTFNLYLTHVLAISLPSKCDEMPLLLSEKLLLVFTVFSYAKANFNNHSRYTKHTRQLDKYFNCRPPPSASAYKSE